MANVTPKTRRFYHFSCSNASVQCLLRFIHPYWICSHRWTLKNPFSTNYPLFCLWTDLHETKKQMKGLDKAISFHVYFFLNLTHFDHFRANKTSNVNLWRTLFCVLCSCYTYFVIKIYYRKMYWPWGFLKMFEIFKNVKQCLRYILMYDEIVRKTALQKRQWNTRCYSYGFFVDWDWQRIVGGT